MSRGYGTTYGTSALDNIAMPFPFFTVLYSFSAWFNFNPANSVNLNCRVVDINMNGGSFSLNAQYNPATALMSFGTPATGASGAFTCPTPSRGSWHHIVVTYDGNSTANKPTVYIDGLSVSVTTNAAPSGLPISAGTQSNVANIGNNGAFNRTWDGFLAHFSYYPNIILSAADAFTLASGVNPLLVRPDSLTLYYPLDGINSPEMNMVGAPTTSIVGVKLGISDPPVQPHVRLRSVFDELADTAGAAVFNVYWAMRHSIPFKGQSA